MKLALTVQGRLLLLVAAGIMVHGCLGPKFHPNPRLRLLWSDVARSHSFFRAVYTQGGDAVFSLRGRARDEMSYGGQLWRIDTSGHSAFSSTPGMYWALAFSMNGRTLAMTTGGSSGGAIVLLDLQSGTLDTVATSVTDIRDVEFSRVDTGAIYFSSRMCGIRRAKLDGSNEERVLPERIGYFTLSASDSVVQSGSTGHGPKPSIHPSGRYIAYVEGWDPTDIILLDTRSGDTSHLNASPYEHCSIYFPSWTPDGRGLLFSASDWRMAGHAVDVGCEIWTLDSVVVNPGQ